MKKIWATIFVLMYIFIPFSAFAEYTEPDSPTEVWYSTPNLKFWFMDTDEFNEYLALISEYYDLESFTEMVLGTDDYELLDMILVELDKPYNQVAWYTPYNFYKVDSCVFMISTDLWQGYVMNGNYDKHGSLLVNYSDITPGKYFMVIYVAP